MNLLEYKLHWATKRYFCLLAQIVGAFLGYIGVAKSENALSFAELARVFEVASLAKLQKYLNFFTVNECDH